MSAYANRAAVMDNLKLAEEVSRTAAVAARHLSYAENAPTAFEALSWLESAWRHEDQFLANLDEARKRLTAGDVELVRYLDLFTTARELVSA